MSRKTPTAPRRIYTRKGNAIVCYEGRYFGRTAAESKLDLELEVTCEVLKSDGGRARIKVTQRSSGKKIASETWRSVKL